MFSHSQKSQIGNRKVTKNAVGDNVTNRMRCLFLEWMKDIYAHDRERRNALYSLGCGDAYEFVTLKKLAAKYGYSYGYIRKVACIEKWRRQKRCLINEIYQRTREKAGERI